MTKSWAKRTSGNLISAEFTLAPLWYLQAKEEGMDKSALFELVRAYCIRTLADEADAQGVDDAFVQLMIATYEA